MINVVVGAEGLLESFHVHEELLCRTSDFFTAALSKDWKESRQKIVRLPEDDPDLFEIFADFLYGGRIHSTKESDTIGNTDDDYYKDPERERLARCWILGDKLAAPLFQDASIDAIIQKMVETERAPVNLHGIAYLETSGSNPLKRLVVDIAAWRYTADDFDDSEEDHESQSQFQRDTIARLRERCEWAQNPGLDVPTGEPWHEDRCEHYHMHSFMHYDARYTCHGSPLELGGTR